MLQKRVTQTISCRRRNTKSTVTFVPLKTRHDILLSEKYEAHANNIFVRSQRDNDVLLISMN